MSYSYLEEWGDDADQLNAHVMEMSMRAYAFLSKYAELAQFLEGELFWIRRYTPQNAEERHRKQQFYETLLKWQIAIQQSGFKYEDFTEPKAA